MLFNFNTEGFIVFMKNLKYNNYNKFFLEFTNAKFVKKRTSNGNSN